MKPKRLSTLFIISIMMNIALVLQMFFGGEKVMQVMIFILYFISACISFIVFFNSLCSLGEDIEDWLTSTKKDSDKVEDEDRGEWYENES